MQKHYVYRMDHDTGFAPNTEDDICSLCGCKINTIEKWVDKGSWVIGIGGNGTRKPNKLIYAMKVEHIFSYNEFKREYRQKSEYLRKKRDLQKINLRILVSEKSFYYFGEKAIDLPEELKIGIDRQGCKRISDKDATKLANYLAAHYQCGKRGEPNNSQTQKESTTCRCAKRKTKKSS